MKWADHRSSLAGIRMLRSPTSAHMEGSTPDGRDLGGNGWEFYNDLATTSKRPEIQKSLSTATTF